MILFNNSRLRMIGVLFSLIGIMSSCERSSTSILLDDVESYIQERPDSALAVIRGIDTLELWTDADKAKYSLLHSMALDKNYIDTTDIRILLPALAYYTANDYKGMITHYYAGRIYENNKDYSNALLHYNAALERVEADDYKYLGLIYYSIGNVYHLCFSFEEELSYLNKAYDAFKQLCDENYLDQATLGLANAYHNNRDFRSADSLYSEICVRGDTLRPIVLLAKLAIADNAIKSGDYKDDNVRTLFEYAIKNGGELSIEDYYEYAYVLMRLGKKKTADSVIKSLSQYPDTFRSYWWKYKIEQEKGNNKAAELFLESSIQMQNLIVRDKISQSVFKSLSDYYRLSMLSSEQEKTILRQQYIIGITVVALVLSILILIYRKRKRLLQKEKEELLLVVEESEKMVRILKNDANQLRSENEEVISTIEKQNSSHRKKVSELQRMYASLYQKQFSEIGRYYDASYLGNPERLSQRIIKNVSSEVNCILDEITSQKGGQHKFEARINRDADNIILKIRNDYPKYSEDDIRFICYVVAGFDATTISVLMNISGENARVKRYRIRHRLLNDKGPNSWLYKIWFE